MTNVTRVRVEAKAETKDELEVKFLQIIEDQSSLYGHPWNIERQDTLLAKNGWWGFIILRRPGFEQPEHAMA